MTVRPWPRDGVDKVDGGWLVPSSRRPGVSYRVTWEHATGEGSWFVCGCQHGEAHPRMGGQYDRPCRHVRAVAAAEKADGIPPRPAARVNPSVFTD